MSPRTAERLDLPGILSAEQARRTGDFIASQQQVDGSIPWYAGAQLDHWDHIEAAMGLTVVGRYAEAQRAFDWSAAAQRPDGSWPMVMRGGSIENACADTNQSAYLAVGLWHFHQVTGRTQVLARLWPAVERALNFVVRTQRPDGALAWAVTPDGRPDAFALLTGSASAAQSLECGLQIAAALGHDRPRWRWARTRLAQALADPSAYDRVFADRARFSMDWYYPMLTGVLRGEAAQVRLRESWDAFVWPGHGVRCVSDQPWVTAAESAELVAALDAMGDSDRALVVLADLQSLRDEDSGGYWTGRNVVNDVVWPREQTAWSAAAVLLAVDALTGSTGGSPLFADAGSCDDELPEVSDGAAS
ncbi:prenyltransferase/squalene oxidase repeat-containing protein [Leekyejoonella antrihumi]|uniref:Prenyltransferase n=1 Tax=Leekyejoonella antrihumi TaxID=1660198 RepID=A0A563E1H4_9MICO|nr:prenyltransferase/squalene oxidase repeat-containing protein [Leekyejoonella antrihumi]TWP36083.1 prenyltransferase [Leekyejoonella antrihumi]